VFDLLILLKQFGEITKLRRREFIAGLGAACWPFSLHAQGPTPARRIGLLLGFPNADPLMPANLAALHEGLKAVGLEEGRNIRIEDRWPGIDAEMTRAFATIRSSRF
jgi:hypothetical protein